MSQLNVSCRPSKRHIVNQPLVTIYDGTGQNDDVKINWQNVLEPMEDP